MADTVPIAYWGSDRARKLQGNMQEFHKMKGTVGLCLANQNRGTPFQQQHSICFPLKGNWKRINHYGTTSVRANSLSEHNSLSDKTIFF